MKPRHKTIALRQIRVVFILFVVMLGVGVLTTLPLDTRAQGTPQDTPTNVGAGGGPGGSGGGDGGISTPIPQGGSIAGYVYNYSTGAHQSGIPVIITGSGWQAESVTDSNGYYRVNGLGNGRAVVNLRLPPGTTPVVFDWPIGLYEGADLQANMGFYWGDKPPMPVLLSAILAGDVLTVQVENRAGKTAVDGVVEIQTPANIRALPAVKAVQGQLAAVEYDPHQMRLGLPDLAPDEKLVVDVSLAGVVSADDALVLIFTYGQQESPQMIELAVEADEFQMGPVAESALMSPQPSSPSQSAPAAGVAGSAQATPSPASGASDRPVASRPTSTPQAEAPSVAQPTAGVESTAAPDAAVATPMSPLPDTGGRSENNAWAKVALSVFVMLGLAIAGWWSLRTRSGLLS